MEEQATRAPFGSGAWAAEQAQRPEATGAPRALGRIEQAALELVELGGELGLLEQTLAAVLLPPEPGDPMPGPESTTSIAALVFELRVLRTRLRELRERVDL